MLGRNQYRSGQKQSTRDGDGDGYKNKYSTPMIPRENSRRPVDDDDIVYVGTTTKHKGDKDPDDVVYVGTTTTLPSHLPQKGHDDIIYVRTVASQKRKASDELPSTSSTCKKSKYDVIGSYRNATTRYHSESQQRRCTELESSNNHKKRKKPDDHEDAAIKSSRHHAASPSEDLNVRKRYKSSLRTMKNATAHRHSSEKFKNLTNNSQNSSISRGRFEKDSDGYQHLASCRFDMPTNNFEKDSDTTTLMADTASEKITKVLKKSRFSDLNNETDQITEKRVENQVDKQELKANTEESSKKVEDSVSITKNLEKQLIGSNSKQRLPWSEKGLTKCHNDSSSFNSKAANVSRECLKTSTSGRNLDKGNFSERDKNENNMKYSKSCKTDLKPNADKVIENKTSTSKPELKTNPRLLGNSTRLKDGIKSNNLNKSKFSKSNISAKKDLQSKYRYETKPDFIGFKNNLKNNHAMNSSKCLEAINTRNQNSNFNAVLPQNVEHCGVKDDGGGKPHVDCEGLKTNNFSILTQLNSNPLSENTNFKSNSNLETPMTVENRTGILEKPAYSNSKLCSESNIDNSADRLQIASESVNSSMFVEKSGDSLNNQQKLNNNSDYKCSQVFKIDAPINQSQFPHNYDQLINVPDSNYKKSAEFLKLGTSFQNSNYGMNTSSLNLATNPEKSISTVSSSGYSTRTRSTRFSENVDFTNNNFDVGKPIYENLMNIKNNFNSTPPGNIENFNSSWSNKNYSFPSNSLPYPQNLGTKPPLPACNINSYDRSMSNQYGTQYSNMPPSFGNNSESSFGLQHIQSNSNGNNFGHKNDTRGTFSQDYGSKPQQLEIPISTGVVGFHERHGSTNTILPSQLPPSAGKINTFEFKDDTHRDFMQYPPPNPMQFGNALSSGNPSQFRCNNNFENNNTTMQNTNLGNATFNSFGSHLNDDSKNIQFGMKQRWSNNQINFEHNKEIDGIFINKNCMPPTKPPQLGQNPNFYCINPAPPVPDLTKPPPPLPPPSHPIPVINANFQNRPPYAKPGFGNTNPRGNYGRNTNFTPRNGTNFQSRSQNNAQRFGNKNPVLNNGLRQTRGFGRNIKGTFKTTRQPFKANNTFLKPNRQLAQNSSVEKVQSTRKISNQNGKANSSKGKSNIIIKCTTNRASNKIRPNTFGPRKNVRGGKQTTKFSKHLKGVKTKNALKKSIDPAKKERKKMLRKMRKSKQKSDNKTKTAEDHIDVNKNLFGDFVPIKAGLKKPAKGHLKPNPEIYWKEWWLLYGYVEKLLEPIDANDPDVKSALHIQCAFDTLEYRKRKRVLLVMGSAKILRHIKLNEKDYALRDIYSVLKYKHQLEDPLFQENLNAKDKDRVEKVLKQARKKTRRAFFYQNMICRWHFSSLLLKRADDAGESLIKCGHARKLMKDKVFQYLVWESVQELKKLIAEDWPDFEHFYKSL